MLLHDMHMVLDHSMTMRLKTTTLKPNPTINMLDLHFFYILKFLNKDTFISHLTSIYLVPLIVSSN